MARPQINFALPQQGLRPTAAPVDTFYQPNLVPPEEAVTNAWLEVAKGLSALSPSMTGFLQEMEKQKRKKMPSEAEMAVSQYKGDASALRDLPSMTPDETQAWFEANKGAFGDYELNYASRPDFVLQFQAYAGRRNVLEDKRFPGADGRQVTAQDYIYSRMDEFADPEADRQALMQEVREALFEGIDSNKGTAFREGVLDAWVPIETQFMQITGAKQQAARANETKRQVTTELYESLRTGYTSSTLREDQGSLQDSEAQQLLLSRLQNIVGPYKEKGGEDTNTLVSKAIEMIAEEVQRDSDDGLEAVDFLAWVQDQEVFTPGKKLGDDPFWQNALGDIEDRVALKERQLGRDKTEASLGEVRWRMPGKMRQVLVEGGATTTEDALAILNQPENQALFAGALEENGLSPDNLESLVLEVAENFTRGLNGPAAPLSEEGTQMLATLSLRIKTEGATEELRAALLDQKNQELLGGTKPGGSWEGLWNEFTSSEEKGYRNPQAREQAQAVMDLLVTTDEMKLLPGGAQGKLALVQLEMRDEFLNMIQAEPDPAKKEALRLTLPGDLQAKYRARKDVQELLATSYTQNPRILLSADSAYIQAIKGSLLSRFPDREEVRDDTTMQTTYVLRPENYDARVNAEAELLVISEENVAKLLRFYEGVEDPRELKALVTRDLMLGNPEAGVPRFTDLMAKYQSGQPMVEQATTEPTEPTTPQVRRSIKQYEKLARTTVEENELSDLGMVIQEGWSQGHGRYVQDQRDTFTLLPGTPGYTQAVRGVHDPMISQEQDSLFAGPDPRSMEERLAQVRREYPSFNQVERIYAAHLLANPGALQPEKSWLDTPSWVDDTGEEFNAYAEHPSVLRNKYKAAVVQSGLSFRELDKGRTREGVSLQEVFGAVEEWPVHRMHFGPNDPDEFAKALSEWKDPETREGSQYQKLMLSLGILDEPISATDSNTHQELFMSKLTNRYNAQREALGDELMRYIDSPYVSIKRLMGPGRPAVDWALEEEDRFFGGDE